MRKGASGWLAIGFAATVACALSPASADEWTIHRPGPDEAGDKLAGLQLAEGPSFDEHGNEFWPSLVLRCSYGDLEIAINWQVPVEAADGRASIVTRLDGASPRVESWRVAEDGSSTMKPDPEVWLRRLVSAQKLAARALADTGSTIDTSFDLAGLPALAEEMTGSCGLRLSPGTLRQRRPR